LTKIRVYELSKKYGISSQALIKILVKEGVVVKSHMSTVEKHVEPMLKRLLKQTKDDTKKEVIKNKKKPVEKKWKKQDKKKVKKEDEKKKSPKVKKQKKEADQKP